MNNQGYASIETDVATPREEKKANDIAGPKRNQRTVLPPINITPGVQHVQPLMSPTLSPTTPCPTHPLLGNVSPRPTYVPQQATHVPQQATYVPQQATYVAPQATYTVPPTVVQPLNPNPNYAKAQGPRPAWAHNCVMLLTIILIISAIIMIITNIVGLALGVKFAVGATGIWGGLFMMITGGIGICASKMKSTCKIVTLMVLAIILAVLSACIFGAHTTGTIIASIGGLDYRNEGEGAYVEFPDYMDELLDYIEDYNCTHPYEIVNDTYCEGTFAYRLNKQEYEELIAIPTKSPKLDYDDDEKQPGLGIRIAFNAILTIFALVGFVASIIASCLSCRAVCCRSSSNVIQVVYVPATGSVQMNPPYSPGQFMSYGSNPQQAVSVPPHGQLQPHYVQNQGLGQSQNMTTRFTYQTESSDYNQIQQQTQGPDEYTRIQSPPPAYQQYGSNEMTAIG